jgi:hypothetical protein
MVRLAFLRKENSEELKIITMRIEEKEVKRGKVHEETVERVIISKE